MNTQGNEAKFAFFYLLSLVGLVVTAVSSGIIIFQFINKFVPDILNEFSGNYSSGALRGGISALAIAAPIYFLISRQIHKYLLSGEMQKDAVIRKWLTYFIMLVTSVVMIGWLISVLNNFLDGELTGKSMLKAATALGISMLIFSFYFYDMKREIAVGKTDIFLKTYAYGALAFVVIVFVSALFIMESPAQVREQKLDNMVLEDFNQIRGAMESYYLDKKSLPENLDNLKQDYNFITDDTLKDPETGKAYGYKKLEDKKYELCGVFRQSNKDENPDFNYLKLDWPHDAGEQCISQKISSVPDAALEKMIR